jgi:osmotically inducible protein OsmC
MLRPTRGASVTESRRVIYTAHAHVTGGRADGHGRTSDGALEVDLRVAEEMGGSGGGTNPEQLFAVGSAACFESALGAVGHHAEGSLSATTQTA